MNEIKKIIRIKIIQVNWHQKNSTSAGFEDSTLKSVLYPYPKDNPCSTYLANEMQRNNGLLYEYNTKLITLKLLRQHHIVTRWKWKYQAFIQAICFVWGKIQKKLYALFYRNDLLFEIICLCIVNFSIKLRIKGSNFYFVRYNFIFLLFNNMFNLIALR